MEEREEREEDTARETGMGGGGGCSCAARALGVLETFGAPGFVILRDVVPGRAPGLRALDGVMG